MLFVLVMDAFSRMVGRAFFVGLLFGFSVGCPSRGLLGVSYLLFANDTCVMRDALGAVIPSAVYPCLV